jgi:predicted nuclease of restriction endonuclease-like (RecB) superfamily
MLINNSEYSAILEDLKARIKTAQYRAVASVNSELILLYFSIGKVIIKNAKYGSRFIENLARDIKAEFPNVSGYSARNLKYMRKFAERYGNSPKVPTVLALLSWSSPTKTCYAAKSTPSLQK